MKSILLTLNFLIIVSVIWAQLPEYPAKHGKPWRGGADIRSIYGKIGTSYYAITMSPSIEAYTYRPNMEIDHFDKNLDCTDDQNVNFEYDDDLDLDFYHSIRLDNSIAIFATSDNKDSSNVRLYCRIMNPGEEEKRGRWFQVGYSTDREHFSFRRMTVSNYLQDNNLFDIIKSPDGSKFLVVSHTDGTYLNPHTNVEIIIYNNLKKSIKKSKINFSELPDDYRIYKYCVSDSCDVYAVYQSELSKDYGLIKIIETKIKMLEIKFPGLPYNQFSIAIDNSSNIIFSGIYKTISNGYGFFYQKCNSNIDSITSNSMLFEPYYTEMKNNFVYPGLLSPNISTEIKMAYVDCYPMENGSFAFVCNSIIGERTVQEDNPEKSNYETKSLTELIIVDKNGKFFVRKHIANDSFKYKIISIGSNYVTPNCCASYNNNFYFIYSEDNKVILEKYLAEGGCMIYSIKGCGGENCRINTSACFQLGNEFYFESYKNQDFNFAKIILE